MLWCLCQQARERVLRTQREKAQQQQQQRDENDDDAERMAQLEEARRLAQERVRALKRDAKLAQSLTSMDDERSHKARLRERAQLERDQFRRCVYAYNHLLHFIEQHNFNILFANHNE